MLVKLQGDVYINSDYITGIALVETKVPENDKDTEEEKKQKKELCQKFPFMIMASMLDGSSKSLYLGDKEPEMRYTLEHFVRHANRK